MIPETLGVRWVTRGSRGRIGTDVADELFRDAYPQAGGEEGPSAAPEVTDEMIAAAQNRLYRVRASPTLTF